MVSLLLAHKADINAQDKDKNSALTVGANNGNLPLVRLLVKEKANLDLCQYLQQSAVTLAATHGICFMVSIYMHTIKH